MAPDESRRQASFPYLQYPALRDVKLKSPQQWIKGKQIQDGAEGLWRVHDGLYDLSEFAKTHPGGDQWITFTKGTDVTEAFETHHLSDRPEELLPQFFVKIAGTPRNSPFTFKSDGFYKTLKPKIAAKLKELPPSIRGKSDMMMDCLLASLVVVSPLSCWMWSNGWTLAAPVTVLSGIILSCVTICAHNYFHRKDSWRMYAFNIGGMSYADWRITHALSHHLHTNTLQDFEITALEPLLYFTPIKDKPIWATMGVFYWPVIYAFATSGVFVKEFVASVMKIENKKASLANAIPLILPTWMWCMGGASFTTTMLVWFGTGLVASFVMATTGLTAGHHAHINFFDGDIPREDRPDWGIHQLDTMVERFETAGCHFKAITTFGNHVLHHLFPTLDHGELQHLYPTVLGHCEKFDLELRTTSFYGALLSHNKQLIRKEQNDFRRRH